MSGTCGPGSGAACANGKTTSSAPWAGPFSGTTGPFSSGTTGPFSSSTAAPTGSTAGPLGGALGNTLSSESTGTRDQGGANGRAGYPGGTASGAFSAAFSGAAGGLLSPGGSSRSSPDVMTGWGGGSGEAAALDADGLGLQSMLSAHNADNDEDHPVRDLELRFACDCQYRTSGNSGAGSPVLGWIIHHVRSRYARPWARNGRLPLGRGDMWV